MGNNLKQFDVIILAGGFGTRLKNISKGTPKALMPINNNVYLDLLFDKIMHFNTNHIYLSLHYKPELFLDHIRRITYKDIITPIVEPIPLGTGGAINFVVQNSSISSPFFVINGDSFSNVNLDHMKEEYSRNRYKAMIGISQVINADRYGSVNFDNQTVTSFIEKGNSKSDWISNGYYIIDKDIFFNCEETFSLEKTIFPKLVKNQELGVFKVYNDNFIDIGIPDDYNKLCKKYK